MPTVNKLMLLGCAQSVPSRQHSFDGTTAILTIHAAPSEEFPDMPASGITILITGKQVEWGIAHIKKGTTVHVEAQLQPLGRTAQGASVAYLVAQSVQIVAQGQNNPHPEVCSSPPATPVRTASAVQPQSVH